MLSGIRRSISLISYLGTRNILIRQAIYSIIKAHNLCFSGADFRVARAVTLDFNNMPAIEFKKQGLAVRKNNRTTLLDRVHHNIAFLA